MYDYLKGQLIAKTPTEVVVEVSGIGYRAEVSLRTSERLGKIGASTTLFTHFKMQDDRARLFGFVDEEERALFTALQSVSGIGPAHGLALLSGLEPPEIWERIRDGDAKGLARTKGIGPKIAQRLCIELADKAKREIAASGSTAGEGPTHSLVDDAISALLVLGYTEAQARKATEKASSALARDVPLEDLVREALRNT